MRPVQQRGDDNSKHMHVCTFTGPVCGACAADSDNDARLSGMCLAQDMGSRVCHSEAFCLYVIVRILLVGRSDIQVLLLLHVFINMFEVCSLIAPMDESALTE